MNENLEFSEQFRVIAKQWVEADSAANMLEETKSAVLSKMMLDLGDMPVSKAEMRVKASDEWKEHVVSMVQTRERASLLKVQLEYIRMKHYEWQSFNATRRAEMKL